MVVSEVEGDLMSDELIVAVKNEIARLEAELEMDPRYLRIRELRKVLSLYVAPTASVASHPTSARSVGSRTRRHSAPERERALAAAADYVRGKSEPTPTRDLYAHIESLGIPIAGGNPINNFSALISNSGLFKPHGRSGWTLIEDHADCTLSNDGEAETPEVPMDAGDTQPEASAESDWNWKE